MNHTDLRTIIDTLHEMPECSKFLECLEKTNVISKIEESGPINEAIDLFFEDQGEKYKTDEQKAKLFLFHILKGDVDITELDGVAEIETFCDEDVCIKMSTTVIKECTELIKGVVYCQNGRSFVINEMLCPCNCKAKI